MNRPWHVWLAFAICLAVVAVALGLLTHGAIKLDTAEAVARRQVAVEDSARLALWRMDSAMATLVAQESARPYFAYQSFYGDHVSTKSKSAPRSRTIPSPLLTEETPLVRLHFQMEEDGKISSPRNPEGRNRDLAIPRYLSANDQLASEMRCAEIGKQLNPPELLAALPEANSSVTWQMSANEAVPNQQQEFSQQSALPQNALQQMEDGDQQQGQVAQQQVKSSNEYRARSQYLNPNRSLYNFNSLAEITSPADARAAVMTPIWVGDELLLARKVSIDRRAVVQACWLDLPAIRTQLLESIRDLLPSADLRPAKQPVVEQAHLLASLPLELIPGPIETATASGFTPMQFSLLTAWAAFALAAAAVALLMLGVVSLSERRASFVSAVTHELRTPLTTFRLYSEMLAEGMVADEASRSQYLDTLRTEADRLMHLVENVLAYARLERGRLDKRITAVTVGELIERARARLSARCEQAGLELIVKDEEQLKETRVLADPSAVDQILFNLVDNACKYAAAGQNRTLELRAFREDEHAGIRVKDYGPGISSGERSRLFRPFHKSAHEAAVTAPGVGLGLALSRRLARAMGGNLLLDAVPQGTQFSLNLNLAKRH